MIKTSTINHIRELLNILLIFTQKIGIYDYIFLIYSEIFATYTTSHIFSHFMKVEHTSVCDDEKLFVLFYSGKKFITQFMDMNIFISQTYAKMVLFSSAITMLVSAKLP